ncbi:MAG: prephenate dehydrogenase [Bacteroidales bacterium]|nr:prephenate dehydrogenase [Bacteroidales bacterium]
MSELNKNDITLIDKKMLNVAVIGIGLIGGSIALDLKKFPKVKKIIGVDKSQENLYKAKQLGIIDDSLPLKQAINEADLVVLATPVDTSIRLLPEILEIVDNQIVFDVGSTKENIIKCAENYPKRGRFVATHPMAGTEFSGPEAALHHLFKNKPVIICDAKSSDKDALQLIREVYEFLGMNIVEMDPKPHDLHAAYVSHISHISSFALSLTVLEKEKVEKNITDMASGGFDSTVRLAKSSPEMWTPIFIQNSGNVVDVINSYIAVLQKFKNVILANDSEKIMEMIQQSNEIKRVLDKFQENKELSKWNLSKNNE